MTQAVKNLLQTLFPTRALALLLLIGFTDLVATAALHANGKIIELNPIMRPFIERSEWLFVAVKGLTLILAWHVMARHAQKNLSFVRGASLIGAFTYVAIWTVWFLTGSAPGG